MAIDIASVINFRDFGYSKSPDATDTENTEVSRQEVSAIAMLKALAESEINTRLTKGATENASYKN